MKQPEQHFGDAVERNRAVNEEALRRAGSRPSPSDSNIEAQAKIHAKAHERARERNTRDELSETLAKETQKVGAIISHDEAQEFLGHTAAERATPAAPPPAQLNLSEMTMTPSAAPAAPLRRPSIAGSYPSGVDAIVNWKG